MKALELLEAPRVPINKKQKWVKSVLKRLNIPASKVTVFDDGSAIFNCLITTGPKATLNSMFDTFPINIIEANEGIVLPGSGLKSFKNFPEKVDKLLVVCRNIGITSLEGCPEFVYGHLDISITGISSLKHFPKVVIGNVDIRQLKNLKPWEMRYILFSDIGGEIHTDYPDITEEFNKYFSLTFEDRQDNIPNMLEFLKGKGKEQ